ncbi:MAG: hypothetical protein IKC78_02185 [Alistipes sp.]|nr:hypothetical protein [Alistipes sp.]
MKRSKYFRALGFLATLIVALLVVSPNNCIAATKSSNKATENVSQDYAWQRLLSSCMKKPMYGGNLKLLGYNQAGKADTAEKRQRYLDKCFSPNSYFAIFDSEKGKTDVASQRELATRNNFDIKYFLSYRSHVTKKIGDKSYDMVELRWSYKGKKFKTMALVSESEIIHDNVFVSSDPKKAMFITNKSSYGPASGNTSVTVERKIVVMKKSELQNKLNQQ